MSPGALLSPRHKTSAAVVTAQTCRDDSQRYDAAQTSTQVGVGWESWKSVPFPIFPCTSHTQHTTDAPGRCACESDKTPNHLARIDCIMASSRSEVTVPSRSRPDLAARRVRFDETLRASVPGWSADAAGSARELDGDGRGGDSRGVRTGSEQAPISASPTGDGPVGQLRACRIVRGRDGLGLRGQAHDLDRRDGQTLISVPGLSHDIVTPAPDVSVGDDRTAVRGPPGYGRRGAGQSDITLTGVERNPDSGTPSPSSPDALVPQQ